MLLVALGAPPLFTRCEIVSGLERVLRVIVLDEDEAVADNWRARGSPLIVTLAPVTDIEKAYIAAPQELSPSMSKQNGPSEPRSITIRLPSVAGVAEA